MNKNVPTAGAPNRLECLRNEANLTRVDLADKAGTTETQIYRLEKGIRKLTQSWMERLAPHLGVPPQEIIATSSRIVLPIVGSVGKGGRVVMYTTSQEKARAIEVEPYELKGNPPEDCEIFEFIDDAAVPGYEAGAMAICRVRNTPEPSDAIGKRVLVELQNGDRHYTMLYEGKMPNTYTIVDTYTGKLLENQIVVAIGKPLTILLPDW